MQVAYKDGRRFQYMCHAAQARYAKPNCQYLSGRAIDDAVVREFFRALQPAQINALERVSAQQAGHQQELIQHLEQEVKRLEYAAARAERQYNSVDPENRLIAATVAARCAVSAGRRLRTGPVTLASLTPRDSRKRGARWVRA